MKERNTEDVGEGKETKESWGEKAAFGRKKTVKRWDADSKSWK
jgi:hypothetical protein